MNECIFCKPADMKCQISKECKKQRIEAKKIRISTTLKAKIRKYYYDTYENNNKELMARCIEIDFYNLQLAEDNRKLRKKIEKLKRT